MYLWFCLSIAHNSVVPRWLYARRAPPEYSSRVQPKLCNCTQGHRRGPLERDKHGDCATRGSPYRRSGLNNFQEPERLRKANNRAATRDEAAAIGRARWNIWRGPRVCSKKIEPKVLESHSKPGIVPLRFSQPGTMPRWIGWPEKSIIIEIPGRSWRGKSPRWCGIAEN